MQHQTDVKLINQDPGNEGDVLPAIRAVQVVNYV